MAREEPHPWRRASAGIGVTALAVAVSAALTFLVPTPLPIKGALYAVPLSAVVFAAYSAGTRSAIASAAVASPYAFFHYDALHAIFPDRADRMMLAGAVTIVTFGMAIAAARTKERHDALAARALEAEHAHAARLAEKNRELERANDALLKANRTLEAFTYVVSHDLKEPARALVELARVLRDDHAASLDENGKVVLDRIVATSDRLQMLLSGLLEFSRASQIQPHEAEALRIEDVFAHPACVTRYEALMGELGARIETSPGPAVRASLSGLCQVLGNLVLNALKHGHRPGGRIRVAARPGETPGWVDIVVEDDGPGYAEALIAQFNRASHGRVSTLRGGFGLIIAREAVEKMGGRIVLGTADGGGARTTITLPSADVAPAAQP